MIARLPADSQGKVFQQDASVIDNSKSVILSTDPPYYDNIGYADLSDFFYVWLRHSLKNNLHFCPQQTLNTSQRHLHRPPYLHRQALALVPHPRSRKRCQAVSWRGVKRSACFVMPYNCTRKPSAFSGKSVIGAHFGLADWAVRSCTRSGER